jgi:hypothetical protein
LFSESQYNQYNHRPSSFAYTGKKNQKEFDDKREREKKSSLLVGRIDEGLIHRSDEP